MSNPLPARTAKWCSTHTLNGASATASFSEPSARSRAAKAAFSRLLSRVRRLGRADGRRGFRFSRAAMRAGQ